jgi:ParB-like chromosome segregation protein Spo0J
MDIQVKPVEWFKPNKRNPRSHPPAQVEHLKASLEEFGLVQNVVALPDGTLLGGHGVVEAAKAAGLPTVDVQVVDLDETRANKLMVLLNEVSRLAVDDQAELAALLSELDAAGELPGTGYEAGEVEALLKSLEPPLTVTEDEPPEVHAEAISKPGDLWLCGEGGHRVLCGDATVETDWVALFGSERARMVWTDPPYGVN